MINTILLKTNNIDTKILLDIEYISEKKDH